MEPLEFSKEVAVSDNSAKQRRMIVSVRDIQRQLPEGLRTKTQGAVNQPFGRCRFSGVRFTAIDEEETLTHSGLAAIESNSPTKCVPRSFDAGVSKRGISFLLKRIAKSRFLTLIGSVQISEPEVSKD